VGHRTHKATVTIAGYVSVQCSCGWTPARNIFGSEADAKRAWLNTHDVLPTERSNNVKIVRPRRK